MLCFDGSPPDTDGAPIGASSGYEHLAAAPPNQPNIQNSPNTATARLAPVTVVENAPAATLAQALAKGKRQVGATK